MSYVYYNGQEYQSKPILTQYEGLLLATVASGAILSPLKYLGDNFLKELKINECNNHIYKDSFEKALELSGLKEKGVEIVHAQNMEGNNVYKSGLNACFIPHTSQIVINTDKISIAGFHELGHALNHFNSKYGVKYMAKMRGLGYVIAGLMEYFAIFSRTKPKGTKRNFTDIIEDNCGKIAFLAMLPDAIEEGIASYRGIKLAKQVSVTEPHINKMKKLYKKAFMNYGGKALLGGLAVYASRKIMDYFTTPRIVDKL